MTVEPPNEKKSSSKWYLIELKDGRVEESELCSQLSRFDEVSQLFEIRCNPKSLMSESDLKPVSLASLGSQSAKGDPQGSIATDTTIEGKSNKENNDDSDDDHQSTPIRQHRRSQSPQSPIDMRGGTADRRSRRDRTRDQCASAHRSRSPLPRKLWNSADFPPPFSSDDDNSNHNNNNEGDVQQESRNRKIQTSTDEDILMAETVKFRNRKWEDSMYSSTGTSSDMAQRRRYRQGYSQLKKKRERHLSHNTSGVIKRDDRRNHHSANHHSTHHRYYRDDHSESDDPSDQSRHSKKRRRMKRKEQRRRMNEDELLSQRESRRRSSRWSWLMEETGATFGRSFGNVIGHSFGACFQQSCGLIPCSLMLIVLTMTLMILLILNLNEVRSVVDSYTVYKKLHVEEMELQVKENMQRQQLLHDMEIDLDKKKQVDIHEERMALIAMADNAMLKFIEANTQRSEEWGINPFRLGTRSKHSSKTSLTEEELRFFRHEILGYVSNALLQTMWDDRTVLNMFQKSIEQAQKDLLDEPVMMSGDTRMNREDPKQIQDKEKQSESKWNIDNNNNDNNDNVPPRNGRSVYGSEERDTHSEL